ncbi:unnamed protein product [Mytilus coruscus]|uniref:Uncharacterized protein n=1 Tax=Mytilus coruscus TaxID=42192 RepID=A0A6J8BYW2_MYTCO|nr:unnamed protein product [Mytilus coruscus]
MMTNFENRLRTIETKQDKLHAKQDKLEQMLTTQCRQETQGLLAIAIDDDSDDENSISEDMTIPAEDLVLLKRAHSRNMFNWNGCGINAKREVCPRVKVAVRQPNNRYDDLPSSSESASDKSPVKGKTLLQNKNHPFQKLTDTATPSCHPPPPEISDNQPSSFHSPTTPKKAMYARGLRYNEVLYAYMPSLKKRRTQVVSMSDGFVDVDVSESTGSVVVSMSDGFVDVDVSQGTGSVVVSLSDGFVDVDVSESTGYVVVTVGMIYSVSRSEK